MKRITLTLAQYMSARIEKSKIRGALVLITFIAGNLWLIYSSNLIYQEWRLYSSYNEASGFITDKETVILKSPKGRDIPYFAIRYTFDAIDDIDHVNFNYVSENYFNQIEEGDRVKVLYYPENPNINKLYQRAYYGNIPPYELYYMVLAYIISIVIAIIQLLELKTYRIYKSDIVTNGKINIIHSRSTSGTRKYTISYNYFDNHGINHNIKFRTITTDDFIPATLTENQNIQIVYRNGDPTKHSIPSIHNVSIEKYIS